MSAFVIFFLLSDIKMQIKSFMILLFVSVVSDCFKYLTIKKRKKSLKSENLFVNLGDNEVLKLCFLAGFSNIGFELFNSTIYKLTNYET